MTPPPLPTSSAATRSVIPGLAVYLCGALMLLPAMIGSVYCSTFVFPKLEKVQEGLVNMRPGEQEKLGSLLQNTDAVMSGIELGIGVSLLLVLILELKVKRWKQVRHWFVLGTAAVVNGAFVLLLLWLVGLALMVAAYSRA
jgi:Kef-type K+ transport system membrane component KefB